MLEVHNVKDLYRNANYCQNCGGKLNLKHDHEVKLRAICENCGFVLYKNPIPAVAIFAQNDDGDILLVKRRLEPQAGMWALPSGYIEVDMTPQENAVAEMLEETGLIGEVEYFVDWFFGYSPIYLRTISLCFRMKIVGGELKAGDDAEEARFFSIENLPNLAFEAHEYFMNLEYHRKRRKPT